ncbi:hypothetical protein PoB_002542000 [Plakobranchus ocellatus]|uniref:MARVEL domain-containing protein n=1 Tax=Plakobranchus ocellatus TaxID=259542 RepID=A0AAV3ZSX7_9GAST|nr:hypothetical protein PoB_002542000 [Plakobranchus ocellatus]
MSDTGALSKTAGILSFLLSLVYRLTVRLTVEFLKIGILLTVLIGALLSCGFTFVYSVVWTYTTSGGSIMAATCACALVTLTIAVALWLLQILLKDVLCLTDLTLLELAKLCVSASTKKSKKGQEASFRDDNSSQDVNGSSVASQDADNTARRHSLRPRHKGKY